MLHIEEFSLATWSDCCCRRWNKSHNRGIKCQVQDTVLDYSTPYPVQCVHVEVVKKPHGYDRPYTVIECSKCGRFLREARS